MTVPARTAADKPPSLPPFPSNGTRAARAQWWRLAAAVLRKAAELDPEGGLYEIRYAGDHTINAAPPAEGGQG
jgi:hypothetical protein